MEFVSDSVAMVDGIDMKRKFKGITLPEILITFATVGFIAALLIPAIKQIIPNKNKIMFQKAYAIIERIVSELISDDGLYPDDLASPGLANTSPVWENGVNYHGATKFCQLFAAKLNIGGKTNCIYGYDFTTNDGITWDLPEDVFTPHSTEPIIVDVTGGTTKTSNINPNCTYDPTTCPNPDQFVINVAKNGVVSVSGYEELKYLGADPDFQPFPTCIGNQTLVNRVCIDPICTGGQKVVNGVCKGH